MVPNDRLLSPALRLSLVLVVLLAGSARAANASEPPKGADGACSEGELAEGKCADRPLDICALKEGCRPRQGFQPVPAALLDWEATVLRSVPIRYPESVAALPPGEVWLRVSVDRDGQTADVDVVKSLHPEIDAAAVDAVFKYRWSPAFSGGAPVDTIVEHRVRFRPWRQRAPAHILVRLSRTCCVCGL